MSSILIDLLQRSVGRTSRMLLRDHIELSKLQHSREISSFVTSSVSRIKQDMRRFFEEDRQIKLIFADEDQSLEQSDFSELCIINAIEGVENFEMALPFFSIVMFIRQLNPAQSACLIDFPALQQTMYASTEEGAWITQSLPHFTTQKLRSPKHIQQKAKRIIICSDKEEDRQIVNADKVLNFGSLTYAAFCMFSNSIDACFGRNVDLATSKALTLMTKEYKGQLFTKQQGLFGICSGSLHI
jgi:fructose-1,6-bisphosphatase/inositol monophosphatase family enzyme